MATNQQMRAGEAELDRLVRRVHQAAGEAMAMPQTGTCSNCRGVLELRGSRYRCNSCRSVFAQLPGQAPRPQGPPQGHRSTSGGKKHDKHTKAHPSRTGQKKRLDHRRTDRKKRKKESEGEMELAQVLRLVNRVAAEAEWEAGLAGEAMARPFETL